MVFYSIKHSKMHHCARKHEISKQRHDKDITRSTSRALLSNHHINMTGLNRSMKCQSYS